MRQLLCLTILAGGLLCGPLSATDILNLRNGTSLRGMFVHAAGDRVRFDEHRGVTRTFRAEEVRSIWFHVNSRRPEVRRAPVRVAHDEDMILFRNGRMETGRLLNASANRIEIRDERGRVRSVRVRDVAMLEMHGWRGPAGYHGGSADRMRNRGQRFVDSPNDGGQFGRMVIPRGTEMEVRTDQRIDSRQAGEGQVYPAQVTNDVLDEQGLVAIPHGSPAELVIRRIGSERGQLQLDLQSVNVNGVRYDVSTEDMERGGREGLGVNKRTGEMVGGGAAIGTILGAIVGGGKGAAIGAAVGAAGGAATQVLTRGDHVAVPAETMLNFRLDRPVILHSAGVR